MSDASGPLSGQTVLVPRPIGRAEPIVRALEDRGAQAVVMPLIDFERVQDCEEFTSAMRYLHSGEFQWLLVTSATTVAALLDWCRSQALSLREFIPESTKIAAVGKSTAAALQALGREADFISSRKQSAHGLGEDFPAPTGVAHSVLLPQSDLADRDLVEALLDKGWQVAQVTAYRTVDFPADPERRLPLGAERSSNGAEWSASQLPLIIRDADTVLYALMLAPSVARKFIEAAGARIGSVRLVAIGERTAREIEKTGHRVFATAAEPTVEAMMAALEESANPGLGHGKSVKA